MLCCRSTRLFLCPFSSNNSHSMELFYGFIVNDIVKNGKNWKISLAFIEINKRIDIRIKNVKV